MPAKKRPAAGAKKATSKSSPSDGPATELLARLGQQREAEAATKKNPARKKGAKTA
mgnify:CR=1 FL=1